MYTCSISRMPFATKVPTLDMSNIIYIYLTLLIYSQCAFCQRSFTLVLDTTFSMKYEIDYLKMSLRPVLAAVSSSNLADYILIPFGDQDVGPSFVSKNTNGIMDIIELIEVSGGNECHENSLAAIEKALKVSLPKSYIYVFSDAQPNKYTQLDSIKKLCQDKKSQVVIFQSGECPPKDLRDNDEDNAYYEITSSCGGSIFHLSSSSSSFRDALRYIKEITKVDWTNVNTHRDFNNNERITITIDTYTKDLVVSISAINPTLQIKNIYGDSMKMEKIVESSTMLVVRVPNIEKGEYTTEINCLGRGIATLYTKKEVQFQYGFSPLQPTSFKETSTKPIPGIKSLMLISLPDASTIELISVHLQEKTANPIKLEFYSLDAYNGLYVVANISITLESTFRVIVTCRDKINYQEMSGETALLQPQKIVTSSVWSKPQANIIVEEPPLIDFGTSYITVCKVNSYPKPDIWWEDDAGATLPSESALLIIPSTYISYVSIENATRNATIFCKCKNSEGEDAYSIDLYVNRTFTFDVIQYPTDITIEYGDEGELHCEANAYPDAEIKWYHNDTLIEDQENIQIIPEEHILVIKNMSIEQIGEYKCIISNFVESRSYIASVYISGLEPPEIKIQKSEVILKPGDWTEQTCTVLKGIPIPEVTWKYKSRDGDLDSLPDGVYVEGKSLKISSADANHGGFYVCEAVNLLGVVDREVAVKVQYAPKIKNGDEQKTARVGDLVELPCDVDAVPKAKVYWNMYQDDVIIDLDDRHFTDDRYTQRFIAGLHDSGMYHCIAENDMGHATRTVSLNVLVPVYIERLKWETLSVTTNMTIVLPCNIKYGNPVPSTRWQYITPHFKTIILQSGSGRLDLTLQNVSRKQGGTYQCVAENDISIDSVSVVLKVI